MSGIVEEVSLEDRRVIARVINNSHDNLYFQIVSTRAVTLTQPLLRVYDFLESANQLVKRFENRSPVDDYDITLPSTTARYRWEFERKYIGKEGWGYLHDKKTGRKYAARRSTDLPQLATSVINVLARLILRTEDIVREEYEGSTGQSTEIIEKHLAQYMDSIGTGEETVVFKIYDEDPLSIYSETEWIGELYEDGYSEGHRYSTDVRSLVYEPRDSFDPEMRIVKTNYDRYSELVITGQSADRIKESAGKLTQKDIINTEDVNIYI